MVKNLKRQSKSLSKSKHASLLSVKDISKEMCFEIQKEVRRKPIKPPLDLRYGSVWNPQNHIQELIIINLEIRDKGRLAQMEVEFKKILSLMLAYQRIKMLKIKQVERDRCWTYDWLMRSPAHLIRNQSVMS